jgi:hypothetical protein
MGPGKGFTVTCDGGARITQEQTCKKSENSTANGAWKGIYGDVRRWGTHHAGANLHIRENLMACGV